MSPDFWVDVHGGTTHFPIAMIMAALAFDAAAVCLWHRPAGDRFRAAGFYAVAIAAAGTVPAVVSGLMLTRGVVMGSAELRWHHLFVWPAFGLIIASAVWRGLIREQLTRRACARYLGVVGTAAALMSAAGYWGGEMLKAFP
jgi:uncharacterized membrane protein